MFKCLLEKYNNIFIYEEMTKINSLGEYLINYANDSEYKGNIKVFAIEDEFVMQGSKEEVIKKLGLDPESISKKIENYLK